MGHNEETNTCTMWEAMCPDAVDGTLNPTEQAAFDRHIAGCTLCSEEFAHAQRGAAWLGMLKAEAPQPPADMLARILASTTGATAAAALPAYEPEPLSPLWTQPRAVPAVPGFWARTWARTTETFRLENNSLHPRMAMTAAMAFFSVALSLNMLGVRITDLRPGRIERNVAHASASLSRKFANNRTVYQVESRVSDFRRDALPDSDSRSDSNNRTDQDKPAHGKPDPQSHGGSEYIPFALPRT